MNYLSRLTDLACRLKMSNPKLTEYGNFHFNCYFYFLKKFFVTQFQPNWYLYNAVYRYFPAQVRHCSHGNIKYCQCYPPNLRPILHTFDLVNLAYEAPNSNIGHIFMINKNTVFFTGAIWNFCYELVVA